uniref:Reverse transcriptase domain-containing protein n=1 Tax=Tanacetum cinerariifolium TaxID=118510 RepID=A0A699SFF4_TANCI|nr:reverse transcriptase domain-containing protein [Tanacetum cinerariifolium]
MEEAKTPISDFRMFSNEQVPKSKNKKVEALRKTASTSFAHLIKQVLVEVLKDKSINEKEIFIMVKEERYTKMTPLFDHLAEGTLPAESKKAQAIKIKSRQYVVIGSVLYRRSFLKPWLRCVRPLQVKYVVRVIHELSCRVHYRPRYVVAKAIRSGYYWSTMHKDARSIIQKCDDC